MVSLSAIINPPRPISTALARGQPGNFASKLDSGYRQRPFPAAFFFGKYRYFIQMFLAIEQVCLEIIYIATRIMAASCCCHHPCCTTEKRSSIGGGGCHTRGDRGPQIGWWTRLTGRKEGRNHFQGFHPASNGGETGLSHLAKGRIWCESVFPTSHVFLDLVARPCFPHLNSVIDAEGVWWKLYVGLFA